MIKEIELPDYLPSKYDSWLEFYYDILSVFEREGTPIENDSTVKLCDFGYNESDPDHPNDVLFTQEFPVRLIKVRAFDFIMDIFPSFEDLIRLRIAIMSSVRCSQELVEILDSTLSISNKKP